VPLVAASHLFNDFLAQPRKTIPNVAWLVETGLAGATWTFSTPVTVLFWQSRIHRLYYLVLTDEQCSTWF